MMVKPPRVGDRVIVPFGRREIEVEVYRVERRGEQTRVTVQLFPRGREELEWCRHDDEDPILTIYRLRDIIRPAEAA
jgi:hypothetical protein